MAKLLCNSRVTKLWDFDAHIHKSMVWHKNVRNRPTVSV